MRTIGHGVNRNTTGMPFPMQKQARWEGCHPFPPNFRWETLGIQCLGLVLNKM